MAKRRRGEPAAAAAAASTRRHTGSRKHAGGRADADTGVHSHTHVRAGVEAEDEEVRPTPCQVEGSDVPAEFPTRRCEYRHAPIYDPGNARNPVEFLRRPDVRAALEEYGAIVIRLSARFPALPLSHTQVEEHIADAYEGGLTLPIVAQRYQRFEHCASTGRSTGRTCTCAVLHVTNSRFSESLHAATAPSAATDVNIQGHDSSVPARVRTRSSSAGAPTARSGLRKRARLHVLMSAREARVSRRTRGITPTPAGGEDSASERDGQSDEIDLSAVAADDGDSDAAPSARSRPGRRRSPRSVIAPASSDVERAKTQVPAELEAAGSTLHSRRQSKNVKMLANADSGGKRGALASLRVRRSPFMTAIVSSTSSEVADGGGIGVTCCAHEVSGAASVNTVEAGASRKECAPVLSAAETCPGKHHQDMSALAQMAALRDGAAADSAASSSATSSGSTWYDIASFACDIDTLFSDLGELADSRGRTLYAKDLAGSYTKLAARKRPEMQLPPGWRLNKVVGCALADALPAGDAEIPGVTTPMLYIGTSNSCFAWHTEDMDLSSLNLLVHGAAKRWLVIPARDRKVFEAAARKVLCAHGHMHAQDCSALLRHKTYFFHPDLYAGAEATAGAVTVIHQAAGDLVVTAAAAYHGGYNTGFNVAEAINFALPEWFDIAREALTSYALRCETAPAPLRAVWALLARQADREEGCAAVSPRAAMPLDGSRTAERSTARRKSRSGCAAASGPNSETGDGRKTTTALPRELPSAQQLERSPARPLAASSGACGQSIQSSCDAVPPVPPPHPIEQQIHSVTSPGSAPVPTPTRDKAGPSADADGAVASCTVLVDEQHHHHDCAPVCGSVTPCTGSKGIDVKQCGSVQLASSEPAPPSAAAPAVEAKSSSPVLEVGSSTAALPLGSGISSRIPGDAAQAADSVSSSDDVSAATEPEAHQATEVGVPEAPPSPQRETRAAAELKESHHQGAENSASGDERSTITAGTGASAGARELSGRQLLLDHDDTISTTGIPATPMAEVCPVRRPTRAPGLHFFSVDQPPDAFGNAVMPRELWLGDTDETDMAHPNEQNVQLLSMAPRIIRPPSVLQRKQVYGPSGDKGMEAASTTVPQAAPAAALCAPTDTTHSAPGPVADASNPPSASSVVPVHVPPMARRMEVPSGLRVVAQHEAARPAQPNAPHAARAANAPRAIHDPTIAARTFSAHAAHAGHMRAAPIRPAHFSYPIPPGASAPTYGAPTMMTAALPDTVLPAPVMHWAASIMRNPSSGPLHSLAHAVTSATASGSRFGAAYASIPTSIYPGDRSRGCPLSAEAGMPVVAPRMVTHQSTGAHDAKPSNPAWLGPSPTFRHARPTTARY